MRRDFGPQNYNNAPAKYGNKYPRYFPEQSEAVRQTGEDPTNRKERRLAKRALQPGGVVLHDTEAEQTPERIELGNRELPVFAYKEQIVRSVKENQVTIIVAETGAGKSTQVPQFLYEAGFSVTQTQPRRPAARGVAERISAEMHEADSTIPYDVSGYHTAEKSTLTENSRIYQVTDGLELVKQLHNQEVITDKTTIPSEVLIFDEAHEMNENMEMLMSQAHRLLKQNANIRIVISSATMDAQKLARYFGDVSDTYPPIIDIPGRTFGVEKTEHPESTVLERVLHRAELLHEIYKNNDPGNKQPTDLIVALPGKREIRDHHDKLLAQLPPEIAKTARILELHSQMSAQAQQEIYSDNPNGIKIILTTNIAKTSLTVPNVAGVIDSGVERRKEVDDQGTESLLLRPTAQADCNQWAGRAGRVAPGFYELTRLDKFTEYVSFINRRDYAKPAIERSRVDRNTLRFAAIGIDIAELKFISVVKKSMIDYAKESLTALGALDGDGAITTRGYRMNQYSARPSLARSMVEAELYSEGVRSRTAAMAAAIEAGGLPYYGPDSERRWNELTDENQSDLLAQLDLYIAAQDMTAEQMARYDLNPQAVIRAKELQAKFIKLTNMQPSEVMYPSFKERELIKRCIYAGQLDFTYEHIGGGEYTRISGEDRYLRELSNRSFVKGRPTFTVAQPYRVEYLKSQKTVEKHILEHVTVVDNPAIFGEIALELCKWGPTEEVRWRGGRPVEVRRQFFNGADIGITQEFEATPSEEMRGVILQYALEHPGPAQRKLRQIKVELERLHHLSKDVLPQFTQNMLMEWVQTATPADSTDPSGIDNAIRKRMNESGFSLDMLVPEELRETIERSAPPEIEVDGQCIRLEYRNGKPLIKRVDRQLLDRLDTDIFLSDGRQVWFVGEHGKHLNLEQAKQLLG